MKKTYIIPKALTVRLNTSNIIAASDNFTFSGTTGSTDFINETPTGDVLTKGSSDVNVWDDEW